MNPERRREIARKGGASVPSEKRSFAKDRDLAAAAGRKGGEAIGGGQRGGERLGCQQGFDQGVDVQGKEARCGLARIGLGPGDEHGDHQVFMPGTA